MQTLAGRSEHIPSMQTLLGGQSPAHLPQLDLSLVTSTHVPLQKVRPMGHKHNPLKQLIPGGQAFPHEPQLSESNLVSLHVPLQRARPARHEHLPFMQAASSGHASGHELQFSRSMLVLIQVPLHRIVLSGQIRLLVATPELPTIPQAKSIRMDIIL